MTSDPANVPPPLPPETGPVSPRRRPAKVFSLSSLILLVSASGVTFGMVAATLSKEDSVHLTQVGINAACGGLTGIFLGAVLAASYEMGAGGIGLGVASGWLAGMAFGAFSGCDADLPMSLAGAAVLIVLGIFFRLTATPKQRSESETAAGD